MSKQLSRKQQVLILSLIRLLERFSFYGMRSILILFVTSPDGLNLSEDIAVEYYHTIFLTLIGFIPLPLGLLTDLTFKQKNGTWIGAVISFIGYTALLINELAFTIGGVILIIIGSELIRVNISILLGRLFDKSENRRESAFLFSSGIYMLGAFISSIIVAYFSSNFGWNYGFAIAAISSILLLIAYISFKNQFHFIEKDTELPQQKAYYKIGLIIGVTILFYVTGNITTQYYDLAISNFFADSLSYMQTSILESITGIFGIPCIVIFFFIYYKKRKGVSTLQLALSLLMVSTAAILVMNIEYLQQNILIPYSLIAFLIYNIGHTFIDPIMLSLITRLSPLKYQSTIYGGFITIVFITTYLLGYIPEEYINKPVVVSLAIVSSIIGVLMIVFKKKLPLSPKKSTL